MVRLTRVVTIRQFSSLCYFGKFHSGYVVCYFAV
jgi:hypothetical protein